MRLNTSGLSSALQKSLPSGVRVNSDKIQRALRDVGIDLRYKKDITRDQVTTAFKTLGEKGLLSGRVAREGRIAFTRSVENAVKEGNGDALTEERKSANRMMAMREQIAKEQQLKTRMSRATDRITQIGTEKKTAGTHPPQTSEQSHVSRPVQTPQAIDPFGPDE